MVRQISSGPGRPTPRNGRRQAAGFRSTAGDRLGHVTVGITLDTYSDVLPTLDQEATAWVSDPWGAGTRLDRRNWNQAANEQGGIDRQEALWRLSSRSESA